MRKVAVLITLVLYKCPLDESRAFSSLKKYAGLWTEIDVRLLIYNNTPNYIVLPSNEYDVVNAMKNDMLSGAYNYAWKMAQKLDMEWLLMLDQDTVINADYVNEIQSFLCQGQAKQKSISVLLPRFIHNGKQTAPCIYNPLFFPDWTKRLLQAGDIGYGCVFTYNSGIVLNRKQIDAINGFSIDFPLDYQDADYLYRLYKNGAAYYVMKASLFHNLSLWNYKEYMTKERYQILLSAEKKFANKCGHLCVLSYILRLILRALKQLLVADKRYYFRQTLKNIWG